MADYKSKEEELAAIADERVAKLAESNPRDRDGHTEINQDFNAKREAALLKWGGKDAENVKASQAAAAETQKEKERQADARAANAKKGKTGKKAAAKKKDKAEEK